MDEPGKRISQLARARRVLVVSGRRFAPVGSRASPPYGELLASHEARLVHWQEKVVASALPRLRSVHAAVEVPKTIGAPLIRAAVASCGGRPEFVLRRCKKVLRRDSEWDPPRL